MKSLLMLFLILITIPLASANISLAPEAEKSKAQPAALPWSVSDIMKSDLFHCMNTTAPSNDELRREILTFGSKSVTSTEIKGVRFTNEKVNFLDAFNKMIRDEKGVVSASALSRVKPGQNGSLDVIDATQQIFGEREGLQILFLFLRYRINASHFQSDSAAPWYPSELDSLLLALSDLPNHLVPFPLHPYDRSTGYQTAIHHKRGEKIGLIVANSVMTFFDSWSEEKEMERRQTVLHEVAHNLQYLITDTQNWTNLSPWPAEVTFSAMKNGEEVTVTEKLTTTYASNYSQPHVSQYGKSCPREDFAESVTAYRYRPDWLKERNLEKYNYLKEVIFDGVEYVTEASCKNSQSILHATEMTVRKSFVDFQLAILDHSSIQDLGPDLSMSTHQCGLQYISDTLSETLEKSISNLNSCISSEYEKWFSSNKKTSDLSYAKDTLEVREAYASGVYYSPALNYYTRQKLTELTRVSLRKTILQDFIAYQAGKPEALKDCFEFGPAFLKWMVSRPEKSALLSSNGWTSKNSLGVLDSLFTHSCRETETSRSTLEMILEDFRGASPLTYSGFRSGLLKILGEL